MTDIVDLGDLTAAYLAGYHKRDDEVAKLVAKLETWERACAGYVEVLATQDAELKRLREELANAEWLDGEDNAKQEIERLREEILRLKNPAQQRIEGTDFDPLRAEIKRLKTWYRET